MGISVVGTRVEVRTNKLSAVFEGARLTELKNAKGEVLVAQTPDAGPAGIELLFTAGRSVALGANEYSRVRVQALGDAVAHIHVEDVEGDACLRVSTDDAGRLVVEPSAHTIRRGLAGVRWNMAGLAAGLKLVAPLYQGCRQALDDPLVAGTRFSWPQFWEAGLAILQGAHGGLSVCTFDAASRPKALHVGHAAEPRAIGIETEVLGPCDQSTAAGSLPWVIDVHEGDWEEAAAVYRDWLHAAYDTDRLKRLRPDWVNDIRLTLQWCSCKAELLDAVAEVINPSHVLLHVPAWRTDPYDVNYPEYTASAEGAAFIAYANEKGFRALPHFNYFAMDPAHPAFAMLSEFVLRDGRSKRITGWRWEKGGLPFPQSHSWLKSLQDQKTMTYLHAGASPWRRLLTERIAAAVAALKTPGLFVDQTLCAGNPDNAVVENLTTAEGMVALTRELTELDGLPAVGGEGLNEMSMQYQTVAQVHLFKSWHTNDEHFDGLDPVPVNHFLFGDLCRAMGYSGLAGETPESERRLAVHEALNALPSLTVNRPEQIREANPAIQRVLDRALG